MLDLSLQHDEIPFLVIFELFIVVFLALRPAAGVRTPALHFRKRIRVVVRFLLRFRFFLGKLRAELAFELSSSLGRSRLLPLLLSHQTATFALLTFDQTLSLSLFY